MKKGIILWLVSCALFACDNQVDIAEMIYEPKIVVEGYIENGEYATVLLSVSAPITGIKDTINMLDYMLRSATVTVSDGDTAEVLRLNWNNEKLPRSEYKGRIIRGEVGKHYSLEIKYGGSTLTSTTYIPEPVEPDDIWFKLKNDTDSMGYIGVSFKNTSNEFYRVATCPFELRNTFMPCLYGNIDSKKYPQDGYVELELNRGPTIYPKDNFSAFFSVSDTLRIKFSTQPESAYKFWTSFQDELLNAQNPIFPAYSSLKSNISGGIGIWSGYGSSTRIVILSDVNK